MTRDEAKQLLPIIQAYAEGKEIERMDFAEDKWVKADLSRFLCVPSAYRIKPEPVECWAVVAGPMLPKTFINREVAENYAGNDPACRVLRMREVE